MPPTPAGPQPSVVQSSVLKSSGITTPVTARTRKRYELLFYQNVYVQCEDMKQKVNRRIEKPI